MPWPNYVLSRGWDHCTKPKAAILRGRISFILQHPLCALSQICSHDTRLEAIECHAVVGSTRYDGDVLVPSNSALHYHVFAVDGTDAIAVKLRVVLVYDRVGLARVGGARKIPEARAV